MIVRMGNRRLAVSQSRRDSLGHLACVVGLVIIVTIVTIVIISCGRGHCSCGVDIDGEC